MYVYTLCTYTFFPPIYCNLESITAKLMGDFTLIVYVKKANINGWDKPYIFSLLKACTGLENKLDPNTSLGNAIES